MTAEGETLSLTLGGLEFDLQGGLHSVLFGRHLGPAPTKAQFILSEAFLAAPALQSSKTESCGWTETDRPRNAAEYLSCIAAVVAQLQGYARHTRRQP